MLIDLETPMRPIVILLLAALGACWAENAEAPDKPKHELHYQTGTVTIGDQLATIKLPEGYRYLQSADARYVVEQLWGNPPSSDVLGLVVPPDIEPDDDDSWAIVTSYDKEDGHVKDDDAKGIDYSDLLKSMQESTRDANPERQQQGYPTMDLLGWAEPPHYDAATRKLYYAENLRVGGAPQTTLNYFVRILGRDGYLLMNAVGASTQLKEVAAGSKAVLASTEFTAGHRYEDFKPGIDKVAAYGIGGLIAGGILAKAGFFSLIGKFLVAFIKPILFGLAAIGAGIAKLFRGKKDPRDEVVRPAADRDTPPKQA
jgi:uncharacterized membrane-anchored protein